MTLNPLIHSPTIATGLTTLEMALQAKPQLTLRFYDFGIILHKHTPHGATEYPVDPAQVATALAARVQLNTGILSPNVLFVQREGNLHLVVEHRRRQKTALFLEGCTHPLLVPLPDLILVRRTHATENPQYALFASKCRPDSLDAEMFHAPLH